MRYFLLLAVLACGGSGVTDPSTEIDLSSATPSKASPFQVQMWTELEQCSGITRDWQEPTYYVLIGKDRIIVGGQSYWGYWLKDGNKIILVEPRANDTQLLRHEQMHALLQSGEHPAQYFNGVCGDLTIPAAH